MGWRREREGRSQWVLSQDLQRRGSLSRAAGETTGCVPGRRARPPTSPGTPSLCLSGILHLSLASRSAQVSPWGSVVIEMASCVSCRGKPSEGGADTPHRRPCCRPRGTQRSELARGHGRGPGRGRRAQREDARPSGRPQGHATSALVLWGAPCTPRGVKRGTRCRSWSLRL